MLKVDIWSDIACPWCFIGKRRFEAGLRQFESSQEGADVAVGYELHSFELSPDSPSDSAISVVDYLSQRKGMPRRQVEQMVGHVTELAAAEGLRFDFGTVQQTRTLRAHELLHLAKTHGLQLRMSEALFSAFFEQGRNVGNLEVLIDLADTVGLDRSEAYEALRTGRYRGAVAADMEQARAFGISGVPFFVIDGRYGVSGAQAPATFAAALSRAAGDRVSQA
jgi:predicted DsbA family dithiol-disulfide isomerase